MFYCWEGISPIRETSQGSLFFVYRFMVHLLVYLCNRNINLKERRKNGLFDCIDALPRRPRRTLRPPVLQELVGGRDIKNWELED